MFILTPIRDHRAVFQALNPLIVLTPSEIKVLVVLSQVHMSILEQFYLDQLRPTLNMQSLANASSYNL